MTREEEVENGMKDLLGRIRDLSAIAQQLGEISVTLAIIADKLDKEDK